MGRMHLLNHTGHSTLEWDALDQASVDAAIAEFEKQLDSGLFPFKRDAPGGAAQRIDTFDPTAEEILWLSPLQGG